MTDQELAELRKQAKKAIEKNEDVRVCPAVLLELVRSVEWGRYVENKYQPLLNKEIDATLRRLAYPPLGRKTKPKTEGQTCATVDHACPKA